MRVEYLCMYWKRNNGASVHMKPEDASATGTHDSKQPESRDWRNTGHKDNTEPQEPVSRNYAEPEQQESKPADPLPHVVLPQGGGAIRGIGEKFSVNAANGTAGLSIPLALSPGRSGF